LKIDDPAPDEFFSVVLSLGIRYGAAGNDGDIEQEEKAVSKYLARRSSWLVWFVLPGFSTLLIGSRQRLTSTSMD
jgi:hypothetical protein